MKNVCRFLLGVCIIPSFLSIVGQLRAQQFSPALYQEMRWRMIGPFRGGRTRAACGVPSQPNVFYMAPVNGGVWKSDDYGRTWTPIFDGQPTQSIGAIQVAPSDANIIYVASGEGLQRPDLSVGDGIYKSLDAGRTWTHLAGPRDGQQIPTLAVDPKDPNRVFAAVLGHPYGPNAERGVYRSTDGGQNWERVLGVDENTGASDVEIDPAHPKVVYAALWRARQGPWEDMNSYGGAGGAIYKSTDSGNKWDKLAGGLPEDLVQAYVAIAPSETHRLYASVAVTHGVHFYRSDDAGKSWKQITTDTRPTGRIGGGDLPVLKVDPKNPDVVYSTSTVTWRSQDGGKTWTGIRGAPGGDDYQNIWINSNDPRIILLVGDQGALVSVNGGKTWSSWYNQPTAQFYHVIADNRFPYRVYGGQQESGSAGVASRGNDGEITFREFHPVGVIEYGYAAPDPLHENIVYGAGRSEVSKFDWNTGQVQDVTPIPVQNVKYRADRTEPIVFSPVDPHVLYYATNILFKTMDGGHTWQAISQDLTREHPGIPASLGELAAHDAYAQKVRGTIYAVGPSFKNVNTIWAGTDDGLIWVTRDGGKNWKNVTPPGLIPWSKVTQITASHFDDVSAYASVSRFRIDDLHPMIFRTHDAGKTWKLITNGLPDDAPADTVREDPDRKGLLFAGTEKAVWVSFDDGDRWQSLQLNLPHTSMRDLWIKDNDLIVGTHGRSFWILDDIKPLRQISESMAGAGAFLFQPEPAYRVKRDTNTDTPLPPDEPAGQNPPDGAIIDYWLARPASGAVSLEILDSHGKVARRYASTDQPEVTEKDLEKSAAIPLYWIRMPNTLSAAAGMHRWVWDLDYAAPPSARHEYPISAVPHDTPRYPRGPAAMPGRYTVRLTANGRTLTAPLIVKLDPRVKVAPAGLAQQFQFETRLAEMMTRAYDVMTEVNSVRAQLQKISAQASGAAADSIKETEKKLTAMAGGRGGFLAPPSPEVTLARASGAAGALYVEVSNADAAPTAPQLAAAAATARDLTAVMKRWDDFKKTELAALNRQLRSANLPVIQPELKPKAEKEAPEEE